MSGLSLGMLSFALFGIAIALWIRFMNAVALEGRRGMLFGMCLAAVLIGAVALSREPGWVGGTLAGLSVVGGLVWLGLGLFAGQSKQTPNVILGQPLPAISAPDHTGEIFDVESLRGHPVLIKLFRGHW